MINWIILKKDQRGSTKTGLPGGEGRDNPIRVVLSNSLVL